MHIDIVSFGLFVYINYSLRLITLHFILLFLNFFSSMKHIISISFILYSSINDITASNDENGNEFFLNVDQDVNQIDNIDNLSNTNYHNLYSNNDYLYS